MNEWVLIFIAVTGGTFGLSPAINMQPIYFQTKTACDAVALEFNKGPEPSDKNPKTGRSIVFGAICRPTRSPEP